MPFQRTAISTLCILTPFASCDKKISPMTNSAERTRLRGAAGNSRRAKVIWQQFESSETSSELSTLSNDIGLEGYAEMKMEITWATPKLNVELVEHILLHHDDASTISSTPPTSPLIRIEPADFADGTHSMDRDSLPNPRDISNAFHSNDSMVNSHGASDWLWAFGQFLNHDLSEVNVNTEDECDIAISPNDPFLHNVTSIPMSRSKFQLDEKNVAQQLSDMTSIIDAENVYGTTASRLAYIRADDSAETGRLRTSDNNMLPKNLIGFSNRGGDDRDDLFLTGDVRANENLALLVTHNLWLREHNYWADRVRDSKSDLDGDSIFEIARVLVRAIMQKIVYDEFLPALLGEDGIPEYDGYKEDVDTGLENIVSSCAYRIGHTMVGESLAKDYGNGVVIHLPLEDSFFAPRQLEVTGLDPFLRGMATNPGQEIDPFLVPALRNHLFAKQFDLMALNIERARDHGIPNFNTIRESVGYPKFDRFDDFLFSEELSSVYKDTDQIDCWVGMNSEPRIEGLMVGPTQRSVLIRNFAHIRDGDAYFYKNSIQDTELLELIEATSFADVIKRNSDFPNSLEDIHENVFFVPTEI
mmetsp:Transcript_16400/g.39240  ORF Transcript_16400/g.39240 Transcript_16400/m.39240 type:complete len:586 (-) Transcript_16400:73-1830(-)